MKNIFSYDEENDILVIHKGFSQDEKFKGNVDAGNITVDISTKGKIRGIEIASASKVLKNRVINKSILKQVQHAEFNVTNHPGSITFQIILTTGQIHKNSARLTVPLEVPA